MNASRGAVHVSQIEMTFRFCPVKNACPGSIKHAEKLTPTIATARPFRPRLIEQTDISCIVSLQQSQRTRMSPRPWQEIQAAKKAEQAARIPAEWKLPETALPPDGTVDLRPYAASCGILTERELKITGGEYDATALAAEIAKGTFTAVEVVTAYCKKAAVAQQLCNCLTEIMFLDAIEAAKKLDEVYQKTGKTVGPLHGVPMTFKVRRKLLYSRISSSSRIMITSGRNASTSKATMPATVTSRGLSTRPPTTATSLSSSDQLELW